MVMKKNLFNPNLNVSDNTFHYFFCISRYLNVKKNGYFINKILSLIEYFPVMNTNIAFGTASKKLQRPDSRLV